VLFRSAVKQASAPRIQFSSKAMPSTGQAETTDELEQLRREVAELQESNRDLLGWVDRLAALEEDRKVIINAQRAEIEDKTAFITTISDVIAKPNEELSPAEKVVSIGLLIETQFRAAAGPYTLPDGTEGSYRTKRGNVRMTREVLARRTGYSPNQASKIGRQIAERENAPYAWTTTREWKARPDGFEGWVTTIEIEPRAATTAQALRAIKELKALPDKPKHGGSPQATEARERARRGCGHDDAPVMISGCCAACGDVLGDRRISADDWAALKHQDGVSEGGPFHVPLVPKGHQDDVSAALVDLLTYAAARNQERPTRCPAPECRAMEFRQLPDGSWRCLRSNHDPSVYPLLTAAVAGGEE